MTPSSRECFSRLTKASFAYYTHESSPQIPPELWCSPSARLSRDCTVIMMALNSTTAPIEKAIYEFL